MKAVSRLAQRALGALPHFEYVADAVCAQLIAQSGPRVKADTSRNVARIAVVGSGPAGFYFTDRILKLAGDTASVDVIEQLPTPFGLVRFGVAPDHPDTKNVINKFTAVAGDPRVRFFGGVRVGRDVSVDDLRNLYDCIVLAHGAANDRKLGIPGEESSGVLSAREFVNWYNGHPDYAATPVDLRATRAVGIVGLGNVALDCARILLKDPAALQTTDINPDTIDQLRASAVQSVHILGRRGPCQAQFSGKELREVLNLDNVSITMHPSNYMPTALDKEEPRKNQKVFAEIQKAHGKRATCEPQRELHFHFLSDPRALTANPSTGHLVGMSVERTALQPSSGGGQRAVGTGQLQELPVQLLLRSVGYKAEALPGVPFDSRTSVVPSALGRVLEAPNSAAVVPGLYVVGWLSRGPSGIIGTNLVDAQVVADSVAADLQAPGAFDQAAPPAELPALLKGRGVRYVTWKGWQAIDAAEIEAGKDRGQPRVKFTDVNNMLAIAHA